MANLSISFRGEESARFTRFALEAKRSGVHSLRVIVEGKEPLTFRNIQIEGTVVNALLDGYRRHIEVKEDSSDVTYWVAGTNATRSIAAQKVTFIVTEPYLRALRSRSDSGVYIPGMVKDSLSWNDTWRLIDEAPEHLCDSCLASLLKLLDSASSPEIVREVALDLRAYADMVSSRKTYQKTAEGNALRVLESVVDRDAKIALTELLGYIGTAASEHSLRALLCEDDDMHVKWAAAIAIGRIQSNNVVPLLLDGLAVLTNGRSTLDAGATDSPVSDADWAEAAVLLGLSRHATTEVQDRLEEAFGERLKSHSHTLKRYACLGLSKFSKIDNCFVDTLIELFGDSGAPIAVRGYAALALSSVIEECSDVSRQRLSNILHSYIDFTIDGNDEPEVIWGLEFMAELASLLEINSTASKFHHELSQLFADWRSKYYEALSYYEKGDSSAKQGALSNAIALFEEAVRLLAGISDLDHEERLAVRFRNDIIRARLELQSIIRNWLQTVVPDDFKALETRMLDVIQIYKRYGYSSDIGTSHKRLSKRESDYIDGARRLLDVILLVIRLDRMCRTELGNMADQCSNQIELIVEALEGIKPSVCHSRGTMDIVDQTCECFKLILGSPQTGNSHIRTSTLRASISEVKGLVSKATWPMPARACPIGGMGSGTLTVLKEDLEGDGTSENPYLFESGEPAVINIVAAIHGMAPGSTTRALILCMLGDQVLSTNPIHIVEGPTRSTFLLRDTLSDRATARIDFKLRFESRDCHQDSSELTIYARNRGV